MIFLVRILVRLNAIVAIATIAGLYTSSSEINPIICITVRKIQKHTFCQNSKLKGLRSDSKIFFWH